MYLQHSVHTSTNQYIPVCTGMYWYVLVCTGIYWFVLVCTGTYQHVLHIFSTISCWNILIQTGTCQDVHSCTLSYCLVSSYPLLDTRRYKAVQGSHFGTRRYKAVPKSPVPLNSEVQGSTWWYKGLVPPCTSLSRGMGLSGTALYRLVPPCIQKRTRRYERKPEFTKYASMYEYILVHPSSYWLIPIM